MDVEILARIAQDTQHSQHSMAWLCSSERDSSSVSLQSISLPAASIQSHLGQRRAVTATVTGQCGTHHHHFLLDRYPCRIAHFIFAMVVSLGHTLENNGYTSDELPFRPTVEFETLYSLEGVFTGKFIMSDQIFCANFYHLQLPVAKLHPDNRFAASWLYWCAAQFVPYITFHS